MLFLLFGLSFISWSTYQSALFFQKRLSTKIWEKKITQTLTVTQKAESVSLKRVSRPKKKSTSKTYTQAVSEKKRPLSALINLQRAAQEEQNWRTLFLDFSLYYYRNSSLKTVDLVSCLEIGLQQLKENANTLNAIEPHQQRFFIQSLQLPSQRQTYLWQKLMHGFFEKNRFYASLLHYASWHSQSRIAFIHAPDTLQHFFLGDSYTAVIGQIRKTPQSYYETNIIAPIVRAATPPYYHSMLKFSRESRGPYLILNKDTTWIITN